MLFTSSHFSVVAGPAVGPGLVGMVQLGCDRVVSMAVNTFTHATALVATASDWHVRCDVAL